MADLEDGSHFPDFIIEETPIGHFTPSEERHEGFVFIDRDSSLTHDIQDLSALSDNPSRLLGTLVIKDETKQLTLPEPVEIEREDIRAGGAITFFRKHRKGVVATAAGVTVTIVTGSLVLRRKLK